MKFDDVLLKIHNQNTKLIQNQIINKAKTHCNLMSNYKKFQIIEALLQVVNIKNFVKNLNKCLYQLWNVKINNLEMNMTKLKYIYNQLFGVGVS